MIETALSEITKTLGEEFREQIVYIIDVSIIQDYESPDWRDVVVTIKVPIKDPNYVVNLWYRVGSDFWKKLKSIKEYDEEMKRFSENFRISMEILEI